MDRARWRTPIAFIVRWGRISERKVRDSRATLRWSCIGLVGLCPCSRRKENGSNRGSNVEKVACRNAVLTEIGARAPCGSVVTLDQSSFVQIVHVLQPCDFR